MEGGSSWDKEGRVWGEGWALERTPDTSLLTKGKHI